MSEKNRNPLKIDVVVIGGGPAGLAASAKLFELGVRDIVLLEKEDRLGGVLPQCIHDGFGVLLSGNSYTGTEFATQYIKKVERAGVQVCLHTTVTSVEDLADSDRLCVRATDEAGEHEYHARAVLLSTGCRERNRGGIAIPGSRAAGIYTAGTAQAFINLKNLMPGRRAVILGSGDIGLIVARRMTLEGGKVVCVIERDPVPGGLPRNVIQCLEDYNIPLITNATVTNIHGKHRVTAVDMAELDESGCVIPDTEQTIPCDTLILSVGLVPEDKIIHTKNPNVYVCGNAAYVHDLVDRVVEHAEEAAKEIAIAIKSPNNDLNRALGYSLAALPAVRSENRKENAEKRQRKIERAKNNLKTVTCILCPNSCEIDQYFEGGKCPKGAEYAKLELLDPRRTLTTSVLVRSRGNETQSGQAEKASLYAVRTTKGIPKERIDEAMKRIKRMVLDAPPTFLQVIEKDFIEDGIDLVITKGE